MSYLRTALLLGLLTGLLLAIGYIWSGISGMTIFLLIAFVMNFLAYWFSDKIVLAMYGAKQIQKSDQPKLHEIVEKLAKKMNIPKPKVYLVNLPVLNAFATGRDYKHAVIAVTSGLMKNLNWSEIEGVVSHELSHVVNHDTLTSAMAATIAGAIAYIAQIAWYGLFLGDNRRQGGSLIFLPLVLLAPIAATLIQLAISRNREYAADRTGAIISGKPLDLASALEKIANVAKNYPLRGNAATSHLFIVNPFKGDALLSLFSTHPPVGARIQKLKELAKELK
ncbi:MAG: zinc metalloprotease HtpX [Candidatus Aenigmarchaeota archaeon]|nr:zinc metalloprotease HtpX [Candidatus Aenigmarchaeota archaeon]